MTTQINDVHITNATDITTATMEASGAVTAASATVSGLLSAGNVSVSGNTNTGGTTTSSSLVVNVNTTLGNVAIGGSATTPTPSSADNTTLIINSQWAKTGMGFSLGANGYIRLPTWLSGILIQWGTANAASSSQNVNFPTPFSAVWAVICQPLNYGPNAGRSSPYLDALSTTGFTQTSAGSSNSIFWFAIGN